MPFVISLAQRHFRLLELFKLREQSRARSFPYFGGRVGQMANQPADALLDSGDLIITIGYDAVEYWPSHWNKDKERPIIHIDVVPANIENDYSPAVELVGDIERNTRSLIPAPHIVPNLLTNQLDCFR